MYLFEHTLEKIYKNKFVFYISLLNNLCIVSLNIHYEKYLKISLYFTYH